MNLSMGCDHGGYDLKQHVIKVLGDPLRREL